MISQRNAMSNGHRPSVHIGEARAECLPVRVTSPIIAIDARNFQDRLRTM